MSSSPSAGYLNEKEKDKSMGPSSPIFPNARTGGGFMPSLVGGLAGTGAGSSTRGGAGVKQSIAGLPTNLSSLKRSPLVAFVNKDWSSRFKQLGSEVFSPDCWKLSIPAILYVLQNNLQYVAAENLDVATFQVTYQMKILTTAGFSVLMLGRRLSQSKWMALLFLAIGVGIVQIQSSAPKPSSISSTSSSLHHAAHSMSPVTGFSAVSAACFTSGLAGVYFEKVLKGSQADLWVRNVQLSLFSLIPAVAPVLFTPSHLPAGCSFFEHLLAPFHDFGFWAWTTVFVQVAGGLVTALVIKYSSNIMKGFATSLSIVISFLVSVGFFGARITPGFVLGSSTVLMATWMYNQPETEGGGTGAGSKGGRRGSGEKERRIPGSPVPSDAPIIGDFSRKPNHSSSMVNLQNLISSVLTPTPSRSPSGNNSPTPSFGYHVNDQGLTALNNPNPFLANAGPTSNSSTAEPVYWSGSRPPSRPSSRTGRNGGPPSLTVNTSAL
ncbi:nucleotide-sugar transporter-domain-containing protein [Mrakia frigida]|uniref:nucleotide-sugar transporter-domain-containing protein n=1 Tax=Mrakia frigida TaxID=29902 RepID=UPI003FCC2744